MARLQVVAGSLQGVVYGRELEVGTSCSIRRKISVVVFVIPTINLRVVHTENKIGIKSEK